MPIILCSAELVTQLLNTKFDVKIGSFEIFICVCVCLIFWQVLGKAYFLALKVAIPGVNSP